MKKALFILLAVAASSFTYAEAKPIALSKLVSTYMIPESAFPEWYMGATSQTPEIRWQSVGVESKNCEGYTNCRRGSARVSVVGKELHNLRQRLEPVQWRVFMASNIPIKYGPRVIEIQPLCDTVQCEFDFEKGMAGSGIKLKRLCHAGPAPFNQTAYHLSKGKAEVIAVVANHLGSAGASTELTLHLMQQANELDWCAKARAAE